MLKQATDLHSSRVSQRIVFEAITGPGWNARLADLATLYRERRNAFAAALKRHLAPLAEWDIPSGGLFFWLRLHDPIDTRLLLPQAITRGIAFMPGEEFFPNEPELGTMRLNFSHADRDEADHGLAVLAGVLGEHRQAAT